MKIITTNNLTKVYGSGDTAVTAVNHLNLEIESGQFTAIIGSSGSGKSSLLNLLGGLDTPTEGSVLIDGTDIYSLNDEKRSILRREKIGFIFQNFNLIPVLSVEENISMPALLDGRKVDPAEMDELLKILNLENRRTHLPSELSGGQQQRVSIGRALINHPPVILADEPTGNLDSKNTTEVMNMLIDAVKTRNQTLVLITHEPEIAEMADRVLQIEDGHIVSDTTR